MLYRMLDAPECLNRGARAFVVTASGGVRAVTEKRLRASIWDGCEDGRPRVGVWWGLGVAVLILYRMLDAPDAIKPWSPSLCGDGIWWSARCISLRDIGALPQHAISHRSQQ